MVHMLHFRRQKRESIIVKSRSHDNRESRTPASTFKNYRRYVFVKYGLVCLISTSRGEIGMGRNICGDVRTCGDGNGISRVDADRCNLLRRAVPVAASACRLLTDGKDETKTALQTVRERERERERDRFKKTLSLLSLPAAS